MQLIIRPYQVSDLPFCRSLWAELTQHHRDIYADPTIGGPDPGRAFDQYLTNPNLVCVWVAEAQGQVIGLTGLLAQEEEAEIEPVIVSSSDRSEGIGQLLIEQAVEEARKRGVRFLSVRPVARNKGAIDFFVNLGFRSLGQIELFQELSTSTNREWKEGISIHVHQLKY